MQKHKCIGLALLVQAAVFGSTITNVSSMIGSVGTFNVSNFDATALTMGGMKVVVTWYNGSTATCTWTNGTSGCGAAGFSVSETDGFLDTYDGTWRFFNSQTGTSVETIQLIGSGAGSPGGLVGFDLCWNGNNTPNYTNTGAGTTCGVDGTVGTNVGWSASSLSGGLNVASSSVQYSNQMRLPGGPANGVGDEFSDVMINFSSGAFGSNPTTAFTWRMDTDLLATVAPEPATFGFVGISLLGLGVASSRRRRRR